MLAIRDLPRFDRPRERCRRLGPHALSSAELLAVVLGSGSEGCSAIDVGHALLGACQGSLREMAHRPLPLLTEVPGIGEARAATVQAALELGRRMTTEAYPADFGPVVTAHDLYDRFATRLADLPVEEFHVAILDTQFRFRTDVLVSRGTLNSSAVHAREIFREAIAENAYAIALVHNHPSGDPTPSETDHDLTAAIVQAGNLLGIGVLDHVIIGRGRFASMAEYRILH